MSKQEAVVAILDENNIILEPPRNVYADRIVNETPLHGPLDIENQIRYPIVNIMVVDKDTKNARRQLEAVVEGNSPDNVVQEESKADIITEKRHGEIMSGFEAFTEEKFRRGELVTIEDFKKYARKTGYSLEKVLFATNWTDSSLDDEAVARKKEAEESISTSW